MNVFKSNSSIKSHISKLKNEGKVIGFVPTMGALHEGHLSLISNAIANNDVIIVSVFVNPTQFDNAKDLEEYPRTLENDVKLIETLHSNVIIFAPNANEVYGNIIASKSYAFDGLEFQMEGKFRDGHFDGVGTIIEYFFKLLKPTNAYFGEKDFQQLQIVRKLVSNYDLGVNIVGCEIFREKSGLAMSSRNTRLTEAGKNEAPFVFRKLLEAKDKFGTKSAKYTEEWVVKQFAKNKYFKLEYVTIAEVSTLKSVKRKSTNKKYRIFIAAFIDNVRLIDNIALN